MTQVGDRCGRRREDPRRDRHPTPTLSPTPYGLFWFSCLRRSGVLVNHPSPVFLLMFPSLLTLGQRGRKRLWNPWSETHDSIYPHPKPRPSCPGPRVVSEDPCLPGIRRVPVEDGSPSRVRRSTGVLESQGTGVGGVQPRVAVVRTHIRVPVSGLVYVRSKETAILLCKHVYICTIPRLGWSCPYSRVSSSYSLYTSDHFPYSL